MPDAELAQKVLEILANVKDIPSTIDYNKVIELFEGDEETAVLYLDYLQNGGFIQPGAVKGNMVSIALLKLTYYGQTALMKNGGLEGNKNIVTIRFQEEVYQRLEDAIKNAQLTGEEKRSLLASLKRLLSLGTGQILSKLLDAGVDHLLALLRQL